MRFRSILWLLASAALVTTVQAQTVVVEAVTTSFGRKVVTPQARFGHDVGEGSVTVDYRILSNPQCEFPPEAGSPPENRIVEVVLLEDGFRVAVGSLDCFTATGSLTYEPAAPGLKTLVVVGVAGDEDETRSNGIPVEMYGTSLRTSLGETVSTPYLPFTSRIFIEANTLLPDANVKKAEFFHRSLPFELSARVPYSVGDKVVSGGRLFIVQKIDGSRSLPVGAVRPLNGDANQQRDTINGITFRYAGPRLASEIDYYNHQLSRDPSVQVPETAAPPRGKSDLVILRNNEVYEVVTAGRIATGSTAEFSPDESTATADGVIRFSRVGGQLARNREYNRGNLVLSNGRIYEVVQDGKTTKNLGSGLLETDGEVQTIGTVAFVFIPSKILRTELAYWAGDLVISNGYIYRAENPGTIPQGALGTGLMSTTAEKRTIVRFERVDDGSVAADGNRIVRPNTGATVIPQYHKYANINADYAGVPLQQGTVYHRGDVVRSNGGLYEVSTGGTMGPVGGGLKSEGTQRLGGLTFKYLSPAFKQLSAIRPFPDAPFPYSSFDYSFPYSLKWTPAETITNHYSWFGRYGYFEERTVVELLTRVTDSKDATSTSGTVPVSVVPPIDARAALSTVITAPMNDRLVAAGTPIQITAESKDADGVVRLVQFVQFFVDGVPLYAPDVSFPYTTEEPAHWTPTVAGTYILNALAMDDKGNYTISPDVRVNVTDNRPFVRITSPNSNDPFNPFVVAPGATVQIKGVVSGSGGDPARVDEVDIFSDGNLIGSAEVEGGYFTFLFTPTNASDDPINYQIAARVRDVNGATATSNTIYVQVALSPTEPPTPTPTPDGPPEITSALTVKGQENIPFSYQIVATNNPTRYGAAGLPAGLSINTASGLISGTPSVSGPFNVQLSATNSLGTATATLALSITPAGTTLVQFPQASYLATSSQGTVTLSVSLIRAAGDNGSFSVDYSTSDGSAIAGRDYVPKSGTLVFDSGQGSQTITVSLVRQDKAAPNRSFNVHLSNPSRGTLGRATAAVVIAYPDLSTKLLNISTRGPVNTGDDVMIAGFIVQGDTPKRIVLRGLGPSLTARGVPSAIDDPTLELMDSNGSRLAYNDDYGDDSTRQQTLNENGLEPEDRRESAVVATVAPGNYTAILRGKTNGVALVEVYDISGTASSRFVNISTRLRVEQGDNGALIAGFIIAPPTNQPGTAQRVVIRAVGPSLEQAGISGAMEDPTLDIYRGSDPILSNDNWKSDQREQLEGSGVAPRNDKEAAIITDLEPGSYSAVLRGKGNTTGVALVEVYQLSQ